MRRNKEKARLHGGACSRRSAIKKVGAGLFASIGLPGVVEAEPDRGERFERILQARRRGNLSVSKWHDLLRANRVPYISRSVDVMVPDQTTDDGISPQKFDRYECTLTFTFGDLGSYYYCDHDWEHKNGDLDDFGEGPPDAASISFSSSHYGRTYDLDHWVYYDEQCEDPDDIDSKDPNAGAVASWHDGNDTDGTGYFGVYIEPEDGTTASERELIFDYVHSWEQGKLEGVSFSSTGGASITFSTETERWDIERSYLESEVEDGESYSPSR